MDRTTKLKILGLSLFVLLCWALYFVVCSAPAAAPFIYADF
jgi:hypothetical protein